MYCQFKRLEHSFLMPRRVTFEHKTTITTGVHASKFLIPATAE